MNYLENKDCPMFGNFSKYCISFYKQIKEEKHMITIIYVKMCLIKQSLLINTGYKIIFFVKITFIAFLYTLSNQ